VRHASAQVVLVAVLRVGASQVRGEHNSAGLLHWLHSLFDLA
jgi:hypothetical protein